MTEIRPERKERVIQAFETLWSDLFTSPVHLDSALSKLPKHLKSTLAQIVPTLLLRPVSSAQVLGIGVPEGEPWNLRADQLAHWRPASLMAERLYEVQSGSVEKPPGFDRPLLEDFPPGMVSEWKNQWPESVVTELVRVLGSEPPLSLRAARRVGAQNLLQTLKEEANLPVRAEVSNVAPLGVRLAQYAPVLSSGSFERGEFEIQDEGSQLMALYALWPDQVEAVLKEHPGAVTEGTKTPQVPESTAAWTVVDACAGAGGKSLAIADALQGRGRIYAYDTSEKKLQALKRRASHAGYRNIQAVKVEEGREKQVTDRFRRRAQIVLVDAPCSGWGVLRRNPDIKWRQSSDVLDRMAEIQLNLLSAYSELVAPGGRLVFGVCTFRRAETVDVVQRFGEKNPQFQSTGGGYLGPGPSDGFFMHSWVLQK